MAKKNLVNVSCASITEVFRHLVDYLVSRNGIADYTAIGMGWTLHDYSFASGDLNNPAANDWVVLYSPGENGRQDLYYKMVFTSLAGSIITTTSGLYWDASTNAWVSAYPGTEQAAGPTSGTIFNLYVYGSLDYIIPIIGNGSGLFGRYFGLLADTMYDSTIAITSGAVTAGAGKIVTVDAVPTSWAVGKRVFIRDNAKMERTTIDAISGNNVTMTLANGYNSGAKIARDYATCITYGTNFLYGYPQATHAGTIGGQASIMTPRYVAETLADAAPDAMNNCHMTEYSQLSITSGGYYGRHQGLVRVSATGITSGTVYPDDDTGASYRALLVSGIMCLFEEV